MPRTIRGPACNADGVVYGTFTAELEHESSGSLKTVTDGVFYYSM